MVNRFRWVGGCAAAGLVIGLLSGCDPTTLSGQQPTLSRQRPQLPDPFDTAKNADLSPRYPQDLVQERSSGKPTPSVSYYGDQAATPTPAVQAAPSGDGYELNFENTAVTTVAKVILGDILGVGYTIDPRVRGTVTIASGRPVPKSELIPVLENALRMSNVVLVSNAGSGYRLIPSGEAQGAGVVTRGDDSGDGFGISVVPLRYTSAQNILRILDSFAFKPGIARADAAHNLILVEGSSPERKNAVDAILSFDVDWMRGQSVGIYPLENAAPEEMIKELGNIMENGTDGLNQGLVTLQPISRLNAVLVVTKKPALLKAAAMWIRRLDQANNAGASVHVYRLRYADARQIAKVLGDLFGAGSAGLNSAVNQIAPGAGVTTVASGFTGNQANSGFSGVSGNQAGLSSGATSSNLGAASGNGATGLQLGNMGTGFGNPQGVGGAVGGTVASAGSASIQAGAFGGRTGQGQAAVVAPSFRIAADVPNNSLVIYANRENYQVIAQTLAKLDQPQLQVAIHATIAEVTLNNDLQFGVQYYLQNSAGSIGLNTLSAAAASTSGSAVTQTLSAVLPGANLLLGSQTSPKIVLNALRTITDVKVLSAPSVVVLDNQLATLLVGDQVPVETGNASVLAATTSTSSTIVNTISYINTGVILRVLPRVNANGTVVLDVEQEVSGVESSATPTLTPTVSQRQIKSSIAVASGQTVLLGGLIAETQSRTRSGIPVLEELPGGIGNLFSTNDRSTSRDEIIVFIEPQIIRNSVDAAKVAEELRTKLRGSADAAFQPGPSLRGDPRFAQ